MGIISWTTPVRIVCSLGVRVMYGLLENGRTDGFETDLLFPNTVADELQEHHLNSPTWLQTDRHEVIVLTL
jgi:hypothetical protein